jgi:hypothetical protein
MQQIPLRAVPSQTLSVQLGNQSCQINVFQRFFGLFIDLYSNNDLIVAGVQCENMNRIVRNGYFGFSGDLTFYDQQTDDNGLGLDPEYRGLGDRYLLIYLTEEEMEAVG